MNTKHHNILRIAAKKLKYMNYAANTSKVYIHYIAQFLDHTNKNHQHITSADFQQYLDGYKFTSVSQQNQIISAIKFFYDQVLQRKYAKIKFTRPRKEKKLPKVIDKEFLINRIKAITNSKHKAILSLAFSVGLRRSEVINLKLTDIDSARMVIIIRAAKGNKDRVLPLSEEVLQTLRQYYLEHKPVLYLFNGQNNVQYSATSCNKLVKKYIGKEYSFHTLRHSCFTTLLEGGTDLLIIQKIAGHSNSKTTEIYTHVSKQLLGKVQLPI